ncbi:hypothetical protein O3P69_014306 [Scylla paramamosain]|uniref:Uncharacterized protein n=1 Tax=Scylla paramamosain TaxID=85552 RepID=A0AAW0TAJ0_SCYPA
MSPHEPWAMGGASAPPATVVLLMSPTDAHQPHYSPYSHSQKSVLVCSSTGGSDICLRHQCCHHIQSCGLSSAVKDILSKKRFPTIPFSPPYNQHPCNNSLTSSMHSTCLQVEQCTTVNGAPGLEDSASSPRPFQELWPLVPQVSAVRAGTQQAHPEGEDSWLMLPEQAHHSPLCAATLVPGESAPWPQALRPGQLTRQPQGHPNLSNASTMCCPYIVAPTLSAWPALGYGPWHNHFITSHLL